MSTMDNETDVLAVHAIPVIVQEEDIVCPAPNCHEQNGGLTLNDRPTGSRPSSQLSQNGSSGYGSTRSQVGPFGTSNRPSPASSSSSSSSSTNSNSTKTANNNTNSKPKRSVWFGGSKGSSLRAQRAASAEPEPETVMSEPEVTAASKTRGGPQYASLRIPNRIRPHGGSHGELSSFEDRGLDLAEAEVDSDVEVEVERGPMPAPRGHNPLRHANSLDAQVRFFFLFMFWTRPTNTNFEFQSLLHYSHEILIHFSPFFCFVFYPPNPQKNILCVV